MSPHGTIFVLLGCMFTAMVFYPGAAFSNPTAISQTCSRKSLPLGLSDLPPPPKVEGKTTNFGTPVAQAALKLVYQIENGGEHSYNAVTPNFDGEGLSLGLIQFNFGGDAQSTFHSIGRNVYDRTMPSWGADFWQAVHADDKKAIAITLKLQTQENGKWQLKQTALSELQAFLTTPEVEAAQDAGVKAIYDAAYSRAVQWAVANGRTTPNGREITTFLDNEVFSGGALNGMWLPQANVFRSSFKNDREMFGFVASWIESCPSSGPDLLYGVREGVRDAKLWQQMAASGLSLTDDQTLLFAFGFIRGLSAIGPPDDPSQRGIFKLQTVLRRGMIATGAGTANGVAWPGGVLNQ